MQLIFDKTGSLLENVRIDTVVSIGTNHAFKA